MRLALLALPLLLVACGERPTPEAAPVGVAAVGTKAQLYQAALQTLALQGYPIISQDPAAGIISTGPKHQRLANTDCDCPGTFGINLAQEPRTDTAVAWSIVVADGRLTLAPQITYSYLPNDAANGRQGACTSAGTLEKTLAARIQAAEQSLATSTP